MDSRLDVLELTDMEDIVETVQSGRVATADGRANGWCTSISGSACKWQRCSAKTTVLECGTRAGSAVNCEMGNNVLNDCASASLFVEGGICPPETLCCECCTDS